MARYNPRGWLANHPRTLAALFTLALLLAQVQTVAAESAGTLAQGSPGGP
jgi:hypothetical protein